MVVVLTNDISQSAPALAVFPSLKELSTGDLLWAGYGSLERQSGNRFALLACHRKSISYYCRLRSHLCSLG